MSTATNELQPPVSCIRQRFENQFSSGFNLDAPPVVKKSTSSQPGVSPTLVVNTTTYGGKKRVLPPTKPKPSPSTSTTTSTSCLSVANNEVMAKKAGATDGSSSLQAEVFDSPINTASATIDRRRDYFRFSNVVGGGTNDDCVSVQGTSHVIKKVPPVPAARPSKNVTPSRSLEDLASSAGNQVATSEVAMKPETTDGSGSLTEVFDSPIDTAFAKTDKRDYFRFSNVVGLDTNDVKGTSHVNKKVPPVPAARPSKNVTPSRSLEDLAASGGNQQASLSATAAAAAAVVSETVSDNVQTDCAREVNESRDQTVVGPTQRTVSNKTTQSSTAAVALDCLNSQAPSMSTGAELSNSDEIAPAQIIKMNKNGTLNPPDKSARQPGTSVIMPSQSQPAGVAECYRVSSDSRNLNDSVDKSLPATSASDQKTAADMPLVMTSMIDMRSASSQPLTSFMTTSVDDATKKHSRSGSSSGSDVTKIGKRFEQFLTKAKKAIRLDAVRKARDEGENNKADSHVTTTATASIPVQQAMDVASNKGASDAGLNLTANAKPMLGRMPSVSKADGNKTSSDTAVASGSIGPLPVYPEPHFGEITTKTAGNDVTKRVNHPNRGPPPAPPIRQIAKLVTTSSMTDVSTSGSSASAQQPQATMMPLQAEDKRRSKSLDIDQIVATTETTTSSSRHHHVIDRKSVSFRDRSSKLVDEPCYRQPEIVRTEQSSGRKSIASSGTCHEIQTSRDLDDGDKALTVQTEVTAQSAVNQLPETQLITEHLLTERGANIELPDNLSDSTSNGDAKVTVQDNDHAVSAAEEVVFLPSTSFKRRSRHLEAREQSRQNYSLYITNNFDFLTEFELNNGGGGGGGGERQSNNDDGLHATETGSRAKSDELHETDSQPNVTSNDSAADVQLSDTASVEPASSGPRDRARLIRPATTAAASRESYAHLSKLIGSTFNFLEKFEFDDQLETESSMDGDCHSNAAADGGNDEHKATSTLSSSVDADHPCTSDSTCTEGTTSVVDCRLSVIRQPPRQAEDIADDDDYRKRLSVGSVKAIDTVGAAFSFLDIDMATNGV